MQEFEPMIYRLGNLDSTHLITMLGHSRYEGGYLHGTYVNEKKYYFYASPFLSYTFVIRIGVSKSRDSYGVANDKFIL
jgi:hypothetical protein